MHKQKKALIRILIFCIISFYCADVIAYYLTKKIVYQYIESDILNHANTASLLVDTELANQIIKNQDINSNLYLDSIADLVRFHKSFNNIEYLFTLKIINGELYYFLDTSTILLKDTSSYTARNVFDFYEQPQRFQKRIIDGINSSGSYVDLNVDFEYNGKRYMSAFSAIYDKNKEIDSIVGIYIDYERYDQIMINILKYFYGIGIIFTILFLIFSLIAIKQFNHFQKLEQKYIDDLEFSANHDYLTKLYNRKTFHKKLEYVFKSKKKGAFIEMDIDDFKKVNDKYGHIKGDEVLVAISQKMDNILKNLGLEYLIFRCGGEEFSIIYLTDYNRGIEIAEKIRESIENIVFDNKFNVTVSMGISNISDYDDIKKLINDTDLKMYAAKAQGKNKVVSRIDKIKVKS